MSTNPVYQSGLRDAAEQAKLVYDSEFFPGGAAANPWPDDGSTGWVFRPTEAYAEFFAFMSLVENSPSVRDDYAQRARKLLMHAMNEAVKGQANAPFRYNNFATYNRANYWGEAWGLTVDWIYTSLSSQDKATIQKVFLRWSDELLHAATAGNEHPQPIGVINNPSLLNSDELQFRWAANNYYTGHTRHLILMSLSMDAADDPRVDSSKPENQLGNTVRSYLDNAVGAWMYQQYAIYTDKGTVAGEYGIVPNSSVGLAEGGLSSEGFLYGHSLGYLFGGLLALRTAGITDEAVMGPQIKLFASPYPTKFVDGFYHSITRAPIVSPQASYLGELYQMANYGDLERFYLTEDWMVNFATIGVADMNEGSHPDRLAKCRWAVAHTLPGGQAALLERASNIWGNAFATHSILYFLLMDPAAAAPTDPRPSMPREFISRPLGRVLARTDWSNTASWFTFVSQWETINHQSGCAGQFEFHRKGEWLTKEFSSYSNDGNYSNPDFHNSLSLQNSHLSSLEWFETPIRDRGGQWTNGSNAGDPTTLASVSGDYAFCSTDMTPLYNRPNEWGGPQAVDIHLASRRIFWLKPDHIIVDDRATSGATGRFKRFNLNLASSPVISGGNATATTAGGQKLYIRSLLPAGAVLKDTAIELSYSLVAELEPMKRRLVIEDYSEPSDIEFLTILQGADAGVPQDSTQLISSASGQSIRGVIVRNAVVILPQISESVHSPTITSFGYSVPSTITTHYLTGLTPGAGYTVEAVQQASQWNITVTAGGSLLPDVAGVLKFQPAAPASVDSWMVL